MDKYYSIQKLYPYMIMTAQQQLTDYLYHTIIPSLEDELENLGEDERTPNDLAITVLHLTIECLDLAEGGFVDAIKKKLDDWGKTRNKKETIELDI